MNGQLQQCGHCGAIHSGVCPRIKSIEYHPDGTMKRVEYHNPNPPAPPSQPVHLSADDLWELTHRD